MNARDGETEEYTVPSGKAGTAHSDCDSASCPGPGVAPRSPIAGEYRLCLEESSCSIQVAGLS